MLSFGDGASNRATRFRTCCARNTEPSLRNKSYEERGHWSFAQRNEQYRERERVLSFNWHEHQQDLDNAVEQTSPAN